MKKTIILVLLICTIFTFLSCENKSEQNQPENEITTNTLEKIDDDYISEQDAEIYDVSKLDVLKPILEIKIGSDKNEIINILSNYNISTNEENFIEFKLFKNDSLLFTEDEAGEEIIFNCRFDENQKLKSSQISITGTLESAQYKKSAYEYYKTLLIFITKNYTKSKPNSFHVSNEELIIPIMDYWKIKNEKLLLTSEAVNMFGYEFTVFEITKIKN